jgi:hypothetical protein
VLSASSRISRGVASSSAYASKRLAVCGVPTRRLALIARRAITSLVVAGSSFAARAGSAAGIERSSWIARAASSTTSTSASPRNSATAGAACRRRATTATSRTATDASDFFAAS